MLFLIASLATTAIFTAFFYSTQIGILLTLLAKPMIDATWDHYFAGTNLLQLIGVILPIFVLMRSKNISNVPLFHIWIIYVIYNIFTSSFILFDKGLLKSAELSFRIINGFVGYYMIQTYFSDKKSLKKLLIIFMLAGLFPMLVGLYQAITGVVWHERMTVGLVRNVGLYHDAMIPRYYAYQTITAIILYWGYFLDKGQLLQKILLLTLFGICLLVLFKLYSKAAYVIGASWIIIWFVSRRQIRSMILILMVMGIANILFYDKIWTETQQVFSKETIAFSADEGDDPELAKKRTLAGRWYFWEEALEDYGSRTFLQQLFGTARSGAVHNDYLRNLLISGLIGLLLYIALLISIGIKIFSNYLREASLINIVAVMLFTMWLLDTIGLVPSTYPGYQWYVWGFIGLAIKGIQPDKKSNIPKNYRVLMRIRGLQGNKPIFVKYHE